MIDRHLQSKSTLSGDPVNLPVLQLPWKTKRSMPSGMMRMLRPATCTLQMITVLGCPEWNPTMQCTTVAKLLHNCPDIKCLAVSGCRKLASLLRKMAHSSPGLGSGENQGLSSDVREDPDTDSNEEDDPINLNLSHSALDDDPLGDGSRPQ